MFISQDKTRQDNKIYIYIYIHESKTHFHVCCLVIKKKPYIYLTEIIYFKFNKVFKYVEINNHKSCISATIH